MLCSGKRSPTSGREVICPCFDHDFSDPKASTYCTRTKQKSTEKKRHLCHVPCFYPSTCFRLLFFLGNLEHPLTKKGKSSQTFDQETFKRKSKTRTRSQVIEPSTKNQTKSSNDPNKKRKNENNGSIQYYYYYSCSSSN